MHGPLSFSSRTAGLVCLIAVLLVYAAVAGELAKPVLLQVDGGSVVFDAPTNISAISVHARSTALRARVRMHQEGSQLVVEEVAAQVAVPTLTTGMGLRDEHMRKYVFTTGNGQVPDLQFNAENQPCPLQASKETACKVTGKLTVRGVEKPFTLELKVKQDGSSPLAYRATGEGIVKLSDYGIERPSQLGVTCTDAVKVHVEFHGKEAHESAANIGSGQ